MTDTIPTTRTDATRALLTCGAAAGVLFPLVSFAGAVTRSGFDLRVHPLSLLALGELGWIQTLNFLLSGLLVVAFAVGARRVLHPGRGGTWGPVLIGAHGVGLVGAGLFPGDGAYGFPAGAPAGVAERVSATGVAHGVFAMVAFASLTAAALVLARRFHALGRRGWAVYSAATGLLAVGVTAWPVADLASIRFAVGAVVTSVWLAALSVRLRRRG